MIHGVLIASLSMCVVFVTGARMFAGDASVSYPKTAKGDQKDNYFGTEVADPYRWLEDDNSEPTKAWVTAENAVTNAWLAKIPYRAEVRKRLTELYDYARYSAPFHRGEHYFFYKNDGLQNQSVLYVQDGMEGKPEVLIDPNLFSKDGTSRLVAFEPSLDGSHAVYGISRGIGLAGVSCH